MSTLLVRSVNLSTQTANAWKDTGSQFARRGRTTAEIMALPFNNIVNLGKSSFQPVTADYPDTMVWNHGEDIRPLLWPGAAAELLDGLMPPRPLTYPADVWIKAPGAQGRGKYKKAIDYPLVLPKEWDWQGHVEGQEWRLITVGHKVVQDLKRHGSNEDRTYEWVPMKDTPSELKELAREAARRVPGNNVIAWDLIQTHDGLTWLFEGNTCPGISESTGNRILKEMERQYAERHNN